MVALNYQTSDLPKHLNHGQFKQNGACGYVLKPAYMLYSSPGTPPVNPTSPIRLTVHVLSGQQLPKAGGKKAGEIIDPFITLSIHGVKGDTKNVSTKVIDNNGFNPVWNEVEA